MSIAFCSNSHLARASLTTKGFLWPLSSKVSQVPKAKPNTHQPQISERLSPIPKQITAPQKLTSFPSKSSPRVIEKSWRKLPAINQDLNFSKSSLNGTRQNGPQSSTTSSLNGPLPTTTTGNRSILFSKRNISSTSLLYSSPTGLKFLSKSAKKLNALSTSMKRMMKKSSNSA